jgi:hypothetical protein
MFYSYNHSSVRITGRWAVQNEAITTTANGSYFEIAYFGELLTLYFDIKHNRSPVPHLWISADDSAMIEVPLDERLRVQNSDNGKHTIKIAMKSSVEIQNRWETPLTGKVSFIGYEAGMAGILEEDCRPIIEFVGDSITEGVLIDNTHESELLEQTKRVYQDDSLATYAALAAKFLNLRPIFMGYGAVGITMDGCGGVPKAAEAYPECFCGAPISHQKPDYILINHGANDSDADENEYVLGFEKLLDVIISRNPFSNIIVLSPFCGVKVKPLESLVCQYNKKKNTDVFFVDSTGWVPEQPLHPSRKGHLEIALKLSSVLSNKYDLRFEPVSKKMWPKISLAGTYNN